MTVEVKSKRMAPVRAGGYALSLLAAPLNVAVLQTLSESPISLSELRRSVGMPPQTTMRKHLGCLAQNGILSRRREGGFPGTVSYALQKPGANLVGVLGLLESWLARAPDGPLEIGTVAAKSAIKSMVDGWSTTLLRALAARPLTLTELDALIAGVSYPSLERRLVAMRMVGQVEAASGRGRGTPYVVTEWLRQGVGPLVSAACWERRHMAESTTPIGRLDVESALLLSLPLLRLDPEHSGACRMAVETVGRGTLSSVGVLAGFEEGRVACCRARLEGDAEASLSGSVSAWFRAVGEGRIDQLEAAGDQALAAAIIDGLHDTLAKRVTVRVASSRSGEDTGRRASEVSS
jgi:DNA-binding HxlR family transcriptional regulator